MGHKETDQLSDLLIESKAVLSALRGMQKDLKGLVREANEVLDKTAHDRVESAIHKALTEMYEMLDKSKTRDIEIIRRTVDTGWKAIRTGLFGDAPDAAHVVAVLSVVKATIEAFGGKGALIKAAPDQATKIVQNLMIGLPPLETYDTATGKTTGTTAGDGDAPHASVQDGQPHVG